MTKTTWNHIRRSPYQALAAIFIMMQTFFVVSVFTLVIFGSAQIINYLESVPQVSAFFKNEASEKDIASLISQVKATGKVQKVRFISKTEALQIYKGFMKDHPALLDETPSDVLPASIDVSTANIDDLKQVSTLLKASPVIDFVKYQEEIVKSLKKWTNGIRKIGTALIVMLALDSIFLMVIIIGIKISQKKEEIEIMRLLSATKWYVRSPFILEGMFYGFVGAVTGWIFAYLGLIYATPFLSSFLGSIPLLPVSPVFLVEMLVGEIIFAMLLGAFASFLAVLRYLK